MTGKGSEESARRRRKRRSVVKIVERVKVGEHDQDDTGGSYHWVWPARRPTPVHGFSIKWKPGEAT